MKSFKSKQVLLLVSGLAVAASADLQDNLEMLSSDAAVGYISPVVSGIGSSLNHGYFNQSPRPILWGVDVQLGVTFVGMAFGSQDHFESSMDLQLDKLTAATLAENMAESMVPKGISHRDDAVEELADSLTKALVGKIVSAHIEGPTVTGSTKDITTWTVTSSDEVTVSYNGQDTTLSLEDQVGTLPVKALNVPGFLPGVALPYPQVTLGTVAGTMLTFRGIPVAIPAGSYGDVTFWGLGVNHNPGFWIKRDLLPFGINSSVMASYTQLKLGDALEWSGWSVGVMASRRIGWRFLNLTPYAGVGIEGSKLEVRYTTKYMGPTGKPVKVRFESDGDNFVSGTFGTGLRLGIINIDANVILADAIGMSLGTNLAF